MKRIHISAKTKNVIKKLTKEFPNGARVYGYRGKSIVTFGVLDYLGEFQELAVNSKTPKPTKYVAISR